jgi:hypothetical protein
MRVLVNAVMNLRFPRIRVFLEKLTVAQRVKKFRIFNGTWSFATALTASRLVTIRDQINIIIFQICFNIILIFSQGLRSRLLPPGFPAVLWVLSCSIVEWDTMLQAITPRVRFTVRSSDFFNWPNSSSCAMVDSASNRNEHQESYREQSCGQRVRLTTSLPSLSRLSRKYGNLDVSQPYGPPRPLTGLALLMRPTFAAHLIPLDLITPKMSDNTNYEAPNHEIFSVLLIVPPSYVQIFPLAPCSQTS